MRLVNVVNDGQATLGLNADGAIYDVSAAYRASEDSDPPTTTMDALALHGTGHWEILGRAAQAARDAPALPPGLRCGPAVNRPGKIVAIGQNYLDHCREQGIAPPQRPLVFAKFPTAVIASGDTIQWNPALTTDVDWEAELGVVVGQRARNVDLASAMDHVAGYVVVNDVTARDLQKADRQWVRAKSLDSFCPIGSSLVTRDEIPDPHNLEIGCRVNGRTMQQSSTKNLIFGVDALLAYLSRSFTLEPGDLILTGTPPGVGAFCNPPVFLGNNDTVEAWVQNVGVVSNPCRTEA